MENTARLCAVRYQEAYALFGTDRHDECVSQLEEMTHDPYLPLWFRLQVHNCLAGGVSDASTAREHLEAAERAYAEILQRWPLGTPGQERMHARLEIFREDMDDVKQELDEKEAAEEELEGEEADLPTMELDDAPQGHFSPRISTDIDQMLKSGVEDDIENDSQLLIEAKENQLLPENSLPSSAVAPQPILSPISQRVMRTPGRSGPPFSVPIRDSSPTPRPAGASPVHRREDNDDDDDDEDAADLGSPSKKERRRQC